MDIKYYETPWLSLVDTYGYGFDWAYRREYFVCDDAVRREFAIPKQVKRIKVCIQSGEVSGAVHAESYDRYYAFDALSSAVGETFDDRGPISWWVEYEVKQ